MPLVARQLPPKSTRETCLLFGSMFGIIMGLAGFLVPIAINAAAFLVSSRVSILRGFATVRLASSPRAGQTKP